MTKDIAFKIPLMARWSTAIVFPRVVICLLCFFIAACSNSKDHEGPNFSLQNASRSPNVTRKIRNGEELLPSQFPQTVLLRGYQDASVESICTGTLLSPKFVLTAGHCVDGGFTRVTVEGPNTSSPNPNATVEASVETWVVHPQYNPFDNIDSPDIAVVKISNASFELGQFPQLNTSATSFVSNQSYEGVGFGQTSSGQGAGIKRRGRFAFDRYDAATALNGQFIENGLMVFVPEVPANRGQIVCPGDSGGPIWNQGKLGGVASFVKFTGGESNVCSTVVSATYVSVAPFSDWIYQSRIRLDPSNHCRVEDVFASRDGGCKNTLTGRIWGHQVNSPANGDQFTWQLAKAYCESSEEAGESDWRLPTQKEIRAMLALGGKDYLRVSANAQLWSATKSGDRVFLFEVSGGMESLVLETERHQVVCVRG